MGIFYSKKLEFLCFLFIFPVFLSCSGKNSESAADQPASGINRSFASITPDGNVYCLGNFVNQHYVSTSTLHLLLQMTSQTTLRVEMVDDDRAGCGSGP